MKRKTSARIAALLLVIHGLIEVSALLSLEAMSGSLVSFGGLDREEIEANIGALAGFGVLWGLTRFVAAAGTWRMKEWGAALGIAMSLVTLSAAVTVIPAGVADTFFAAPVLIFLLYAWFGNKGIGEPVKGDDLTASRTSDIPAF